MIANTKLLSGIKTNSIVYVLFLTLINQCLYHAPLMDYALNNLDVTGFHGLVSITTLNIIVFVFTFLVFALLSLVSVYLLRVVFSVFAVINAVALYFMVQYEVVLDQTMMGNIFNTQFSESSEFFHYKLFIYLLLFAVMPIFFVYKVKPKKNLRKKTLLTMTLMFVFLMVWAYLVASTWMWFDKNSKHLGGRILPWAYVIGIPKYINENNKSKVVYKKLPDLNFNDNDTKLVVLVIGETARADNLELYGYHKPTNPKLKKTNAVPMKNTKSCATYTTASVACMLTHDGKTQVKYEPLPNYLKRNGVNVVWRANNWGQPNLDVNTYVHVNELRKNCVLDDCNYDGALLSNIEAEFETANKQNTLIVLHTKGSHGPSYNTRSPEAFKKFKPECESVNLKECSKESLYNAYDNTIIYTDYFLEKIISMLKKVDVPSTMIYISDHGESLGEYNLFLHGTPYAIAPDVQKDIPFIVWMSDSFKQVKGITEDDLKAYESNTHSKVFHSVLGAFGSNSDVYNPKLDIFRKRD